jgi:large subunit ribosomal protein L7e
MNPQVKKIFRLFRLRQINNGVFIRINKATLNMLKRIEPFVTYGYPSRATISKLLYKRGFVRVNRSRIPITNNTIVEQNLGKQNITSIEDLVEEITNVGPNFKVANNFLWPFKLNNPRGGWNNKNHPFQKDGDWGNREELINQLIKKML